MKKVILTFNYNPHLYKFLLTPDEIQHILETGKYKTLDVSFIRYARGGYDFVNNKPLTQYSLLSHLWKIAHKPLPGLFSTYTYTQY